MAIFCDVQRANDHDLPLICLLLESYSPLICLLPAGGFDQFYEWIARMGMRGGDEDLHRFDGVLFGAEQFAVMIASMCKRSTKGRCTMYKGVQRLIGLCEGGTIASIYAVHLPFVPQAIRLSDDILRFAELGDRARAAKNKKAQKNNMKDSSFHACSFLREARRTMTAVMAERVSLTGMDHQTPSKGSAKAIGNSNANGMR